MTKDRPSYWCKDCGATVAKWYGKCPQCQSWGSLEEQAVISNVGAKTKTSNISDITPLTAAQILQKNSTSPESVTPTGINEFDRVIGGGLTPGGVTLLGGEPGAGKSTILTLIASQMSKTCSTLIISGEESETQIALRAKRIGVSDSDNVTIVSESNLSRVIALIEKQSPGFLVIDSIQTIASPEIDSRMGSQSQVIEVATMVTRTAKKLNIPTVIVGHITKDGTIAGPKTVEHLVDTVLTLEGDRDTPLKLLRAIKNRYGSTDEIGCFQHEEHGIVEVSDPSGLLLSRGEVDGVSGAVTSLISEGRRVLPIEVQSLVVLSQLSNPRRAFSGIDPSRGTMILAIVERHAGQRIHDKDVYLAMAAGLRTKDPSIDLAVAAAVISSLNNVSIPRNTIILGETTLTGEIRPPRGLQRKLNEAERLGFQHAIIPSSAGPVKTNLHITQVSGMHRLPETLAATTKGS